MKKEKKGKILIFYTNEWLAELCYFAAPAAEWLHTPPSPPSSPNYSGLNELPDIQYLSRWNTAEKNVQREIQVDPTIECVTLEQLIGMQNNDLVLCFHIAKGTSWGGSEVNVKKIWRLMQLFLDFFSSGDPYIILLGVYSLSVGLK
jgi:hypothetical protein